MASKIFHCYICDCNVSTKSKLKHLKSKKHITNLNGVESEDDTDKKECCKCHKMKGLELFRDDNLTCNHCLDVKNQYRRNNPDKTAKWRKTYFEKNKDEVYTCPICDSEIKKYKKTQHENGIGHKYLSELKEKGEEMEKPDKISTDKDGKEWYECFTCKACMLKNAWASHLIGNHHLKCERDMLN